MKNILLLVLLSFLIISTNGQVKKIKKVYYTGPSTNVTVIVSGSIRGKGEGLSTEDPIAGILVWFDSNGEDGSMGEARILRGTTYYKPNPDTLTFVSNDDRNAQYLYLCVITDAIVDTNYYVSNHYQVQVNDSIYQIGWDNVLELDSLLITMVAGNSGERPISFQLKQNYPNPFNPSTIIEYEIYDRSSVKIAIYNSNGQLVRVFNEGEKIAGTYSLLWNGKNETGTRLASGTYYYQIQSSDFVQAKKMILLK